MSSVNPLRGILKTAHPIAKTEKKVVWHESVRDIVSKTHVIMKNGFFEDYSLPPLDKKAPLFILKRDAHKLKKRLEIAGDSLTEAFIKDLSEHIQSFDDLIAERENLEAALKEEEAEFTPTPPDPPEPDLLAWLKDFENSKRQ